MFIMVKYNTFILIHFLGKQLLILDSIIYLISNCEIIKIKNILKHKLRI